MDGDNSEPTFKLGLTMAGAVSAGAYTAGVVDFLLEALDAIEDVRRGADTDYLKAGLPGEKPIFDPPHRVQIAAMSGTSAGAIVTAITTTILGTRVPPVTSLDRFQTADEDTGNPLYDSWVQRIHYNKLLSTEDLRRPPVLSLLNSCRLGKIAEEALESSKKSDQVRSYVAEGLPVFLCVSNLRGVRYSLKLESGDAATEHQMSLHADHVGFCYRPGKEGNQKECLSLIPGEGPENWDTLAKAALASSAFPLGLAARSLERDFSNYLDREWFVASAEQPPVRRERYGKLVEPPDDPASWRSQSGEFRQLPPLDKETDFPDGRYMFANVDGGVFNNEPLELCREALAREEGRNPRHPLEAKRAVLLIDPFPNLFGLDKHYNADNARELMAVARRIFGALLSQARFKADELALAMDANVASRFAILPVRYEWNDQPEEYPRPKKYALACGSLGGFGGFLSKEFRHHDYMLGRRNCQCFLQCHFVLPAEQEEQMCNPLMVRWIDRKTREAFAVPRRITVDYQGRGQDREIAHLPIIPLLGKLGSPDYTRMPEWPVQPSDLRMDELRAAVTERANKLKERLVEQYQPTWLFRQGINFFWWRKRKEWIERFAIEPIITSLREHGDIRPID